MRKRKWMLILLIILIPLNCIPLASSTGAGSSTEDWTMFRHDLAHSGYTVGNGPTNSAKLLWAFLTMEAVASSPAVANGCVFAGCKDGAVYCINCSNGELVWYFYSNGSEVNSSPAIYHEHVYVGSNDGYIYCIDVATGKLSWRVAIGGFVRSSPAIVEGRVYVGSGTHDVYCLNASDGAEIWRCPTSQRVQSSPAVSDGAVYVATDDFHVYALNASTGNEIWRRHTGSFVSSPSVNNGYLYIGSIDGYVCALNASTGAKIWEFQTENSVSSSPAVAYGYVYVGCDDNNVYCLNASNGKEVWQSSTGYRVLSSPAVADGYVYVGSEDYNIYCLDASTGVKKWSYATGNYVDSSPAIVNGTLYVGSHDHHVYAFALYNSTIENLPLQSPGSLPWSTIAFDVISITVLTAIIFAIAVSVYTTIRAKRNAQETSIPGQKVPWYSKHADALCILAILAFSTIFFVNLGSGPLWATDEQTYSQWAFHMIKTGDYLDPWAFGELALWIGKPPLFMWLMSLSYQLFGITNFASRFSSAIFGTLSLVLVFYLGRKLYNLYVGLFSALVLGTFTTFYVFARHAMTDVTFVFFILASIYFLLLSEKTEETKRYVVLSGLFFGLALMTKQIIAFLIPLIAIFYFIATKRSIRFLFTKRFALFLGVGLLVVSPWVIYMTIRFGSEFWQFFLVYSNITRATSAIEGHTESYLYYFSQLVNSETLLWVVLLPFAVGLSAFKSFIKRSKEDTLILAWMLIVLVVFTLAQTKLYWYILPAFPAFAIAMGSFLYALSKTVQSSLRFLSLKAQEVVELAKSWKHRKQAGFNQRWVP